LKRTACVILAICAVLFTASCSSDDRQSYNTSFVDLFDTAATVIAYSKDAETFASEADAFHNKLAEYNQLYDIYNDYTGVNNLKTVNENAGVAPVEVDKRIIDLLLFGKEIYGISGGKVNIAFGSVLEIWHNYRTFGINDPENAELPPQDELEEAAKHTDINDVIIDEDKSTVYLSDAEMRLDVGAIAKGYAVEQVCQWAMENGWTDAGVSIGGNVRTMGTKAGGEPWKIGIEDPDGGDYLCTLNAVDISIVTSGDYQRYYVVDGVKYHHIIDPTTLYPAKYSRSVSVVTKDSGLADGLSTTLFLMSPEDGLKLVESMDGVEAFWVLEDGTQQMSSGFSAYIAE